MTHCFYDFYGLRKAQQVVLFQELENLPREVWSMYKRSRSKLITTALHWKWKKRAASDARLLL